MEIEIGAGYRELDLDEKVDTNSGILETRWCGIWIPIGAVSKETGGVLFSGDAVPYRDWKNNNWVVRVPTTPVPPAHTHGFVLLRMGDVICRTDEKLVGGKWVPVPTQEIGHTIQKARNPRRRIISVPLPPLSPETKEAMQEAAEAMGEMASTILPESQDRKETGYTVEEVRESQRSNTPTEDDLLRFTGMPKTITPDHPWWPRSFTPNKYTRYIPTLDGRKVPVDVYCVLAAFPTGSSAVDHAVKKLLAPGQRGHKDRIQDLKEARDSLNRAIELEETVDG